MEELVHQPSIAHPQQSTTGGNTSDQACAELYRWKQKETVSTQHVDEASAMEFILSHPIKNVDAILSQTICHPKGQFRTTKPQTWNASDSQLVHDWEFKLIYIAIHDLYHRPAREEHPLRQYCPDVRDPYPHRCDSTKFLVTSLKDIGLGAALRLNAVAHILTGIATSRIPLFVNNGTVGPEFLQSPWQLASCPSGDMHCVFQPLSPCTLLSTDLANATVLDKATTQDLQRSGSEPIQLQDNRVLVTESKISSARFDRFEEIHKNVRQKIYRRVEELIEEWKSGSKKAPIKPQQWDVLKAASERILLPDNDDVYDHYDYGHREYRIPHAILLYLLRPNLDAAKSLQQKLKQILPDSMDPNKTIGMPIRGSDKCEGESTCLEFAQYMKLAKETWMKTGSNGNVQGSVIVTTEDKKLFEMRHGYINKTGFPLSLIVNEEDSLQSTGAVKEYGEQADEVVKSSILALQMQLHAGQVFGNCCSNFHLMLFDILREGCGIVIPKARCLQETKKYNICCAWTKGNECDVVWQRHRRARETPMERAVRELEEHGMKVRGFGSYY
eukprot:Nitzschia sp. Nitz4//scaffold36_size144017//83321//84991//NITZ4_003099-RA/size144017-processed-gene-0.238-mRNA-1//1//CDS//3329549495//5587//frame0